MKIKVTILGVLISLLNYGQANNTVIGEDSTNIVRMLKETEWQMRQWFGADTIILLLTEFPIDSTIHGERYSRMLADYCQFNNLYFDSSGVCHHSRSIRSLQDSANSRFFWTLESLKITNDRVSIHIIGAEYTDHDILDPSESTKYEYQIVLFDRQRMKWILTKRE